MYKVVEDNNEYEFKTTDIVYKIPYFDAIKEYSEGMQKAVYLVEYKDINKIQKGDPVFEIINKE